jgi:hypothetical protein
MTRLFATVALLVALAAPAKAQLSPPPGENRPITPTQMAIIVATLAGYQVNCDDLGPKDTAYMAAAAIWVGPALLAAATRDIAEQIERRGTKAWCGQMKDDVEADEHVPRWGPWCRPWGCGQTEDPLILLQPGGSH